MKGTMYVEAFRFCPFLCIYSLIATTLKPGFHIVVTSCDTGVDSRLRSLAVVTKLKKSVSI